MGPERIACYKTESSNDVAAGRLTKNVRKVHFKENEKSDASVPIELLFVLEGALNGHKVHILKNDGCSTNVISKQFRNSYRSSFDVVSKDVMVCHSKEGTSEVPNEVVLGGVLDIGDHRYVSNWAVSDCRYYIIWVCHGMLRMMPR